METSSHQLKEKVLRKQIRQYAWWIGGSGRRFNRLVSPLGWRGSRAILQWAGRPSGALAWPLGLGLLPLNAENNNRDLWANEARLLIPNLLRTFENEHQLHIDRGGILYAALRLHELGIKSPRFLDRVTAVIEPLLIRSGAQEGKLSYMEGREEVLVDTLGMICPALARLSRLNRKTCYEDLAFAQMQAFHNHGTDSETGWTWHAFHRKTGEPLGPAGWGRGVAWYFLALVDTALEIESGGRRDILMHRAMELMEKLISVQRADGHWPCLLTNNSSHPDSSVTAMVAYSLTRLAANTASNSTLIPYKNMSAALAALDSSTDASGRILLGSGEARGIGDYSTSFGSHLWSQGPGVAAQLCAGMQ